MVENSLNYQKYNSWYLEEDENVYNKVTCYYCLHNPLMDWHETTIEICEQDVKDIWKLNWE
jgi:hypothetical protein